MNTTKYTLPNISDTWRIENCSFEVLVSAYLSHIKYLENIAENAFEKTLCSELKKTRIYEIRDEIIDFRTKNMNAISLHNDFLNDMSKRLNIKQTTWNSECKLLTNSTSSKIGAISAAIFNRIETIYEEIYSEDNKTPVYKKVNSSWISDEFAPYILKLHNMVSNIVINTKSAVKSAKNAALKEIKQKSNSGNYSNNNSGNYSNNNSPVERPPYVQGVSNIDNKLVIPIMINGEIQYAQMSGCKLVES